MLGVVILLGLLRLTDILFGLPFHVDRIFAGLADDSIPFRQMTPDSAIHFILSSAAIFFIQGNERRRQVAGQVFSIILFFSSLIILLVYLYGGNNNYENAYVSVALSTAICFFLVSLALLFLRADAGIIKEFTSPLSGSITARIMIPAAVVIPSLLGLLNLHDLYSNIFHYEWGIVLNALVIIVLFIAVIWYIAYALNRRDMRNREIASDLRDSEAQNRSIFHYAPDAIIVIDSAGRIVKWNSLAVQLFGWDTGEVIGRQVEEIVIPPESRQKYREDIMRYIETGTSELIGRTVDLWALRKNGSTFSASLRIAPMTINGQQYFTGFVRDITERKEMENRLKSFNEELSRQVAAKTSEIIDTFERITDGFIALDKDFRYVFLNKKAEAIIQMDASSLIGRNVWEVFPSAVGTETYEVFNRAMKEQRYMTNTDFFPPLNLWQENHIYPSPEGLSVFIRDISDRMRAEESLHASEQKYKLLFESNPLAMWMLSLPEYDVIEVNNAALEQYGYNREEFLSLDIFTELRPSEDTEKLKAITNPEFRGRHNSGIWRHMKSNGDVIYVDVVTHDIQYQGRPTRLVLAKDVTEQYMAEARLKEAYESTRQLAEHLQNVREEERLHISREIHDELGQLLTVLKMDLSWLNKKSPPSDSAGRDKLTGSLEMIDTIVKKVRQIASELRPNLIDDLGLQAAMEWHLDEFSRRSGIQKEACFDGVDTSLPDHLKMGLFRIFQESLTNVGRHSGANKVKVSLVKEENRLVLKVIDNGKGFEEKSNTKMTLGLLGMKERTMMMGGNYSITSSEGKGTTVTVEVPLASEQLKKANTDA